MLDPIERIIQNLNSGLPGKVAHKRLAPFAARMDYSVPEDAFKAAVMILLYQKNEEWYFPLITRQSYHPQDKHKGQIALPGGRIEPIDLNLWDTALRETTEEIGVFGSQIQHLAALSPLYIPVSKHHVFPFLAIYEGLPEFKIQESEIHSLHEIQLRQLIQQENRIRQILKTTDGPILEVPTIQIEQLTIWGATAMILEEFSDLSIGYSSESN